MPIRQDPINGGLSPKLKAAFSRTLPPPRWQTYFLAAGGDESRAMRLYLWNAAVGQAFQFPLQVVEVALRNVVNTALVSIYGANWWSSAPCRAHLGHKRTDEIDKAEQRLLNKYGHAPSTDELMASLTFGFWAAITHPKVNRLWPAQRFSAFPSLPAAMNIMHVSQNADSVQDLRNRIFHHEPLIGRNLLDDYSNIDTLLGWICPQTNVWMRKNTCVPAVIRQRP